MMTSLFPRMREPVLALALVAVPGQAVADLSARDVWEAFSKQLTPYGQIQADLAQAGPTLTARAITLSTEIDGMRSETALSGAISFRENADGTVSIQFPAQMTATLNVTGATGGASSSASYAFSQQGMEVTASGEPGRITHDFSAPQMSYTLQGMTADGTPMGGTMQLDLTNTAGSWLSAGETLTEVTADYTIEALSVDAAFTDPATNGEIKFTAQMDAVAAQSTNTIPDGMQSMSPQAIFASGFGITGQMQYGPVSYAADVTSKGQIYQLLGNIAQGSASVSLDGDQVRYAVTSEDMTVAGRMSGLPLPPLEVQLERSSFDLRMPLAQTDTARDFGLGMALEGFTVNDFIWSMLDPTRQLPRDPATVALDLKGTGNWLIDIFDTEALENTTSLGKIETLSLEALEISIAGASLTGDGAFTFDNDDLASFGGVPRPQGSVDLALRGGITLLDTLTAMNVVPQQQALGIKALSGLFTKPGSGPDTLTSRIEIDPTGRVLANGQQIR